MELPPAKNKHSHSPHPAWNFHQPKTNTRTHRTLQHCCMELPPAKNKHSHSPHPAALLTFIQKFPDSSPAWNTKYPEVYRVFSQLPMHHRSITIGHRHFLLLPL
jgi:hypothetical protein